MMRMLVLHLTLVLLCTVWITDARTAKQSHLRRRRGVPKKLDDEILPSWSGTIESPGYPGKYPIDVEKTYIINLPDPKAYYKVTFDIETFKVEYQASCYWDYLLINAGGIGKLCGTMHNTQKTADEVQGSVSLQFTSDEVINDDGFRIKYTVEKLSDGCTYMPCKNNATCVPSGRSNYTCNCTTDFMGTNCDVPVPKPCDSNACMNNATCYNINSYNYSCMCSYGFEGYNCEKVTYDPCNPSPCKNGGVCKPYGGSNYTCDCYGSYYGNHCENYSSGNTNSTNTTFDKQTVYEYLQSAKNKSHTSHEKIQSVKDKLKEVEQMVLVK